MAIRLKSCAKATCLGVLTDNQYNMMLFQYCLQYNKMNGLFRELRLYVIHSDCELTSLNHHFSNGKTIHMKVLYKTKGVT